MNIAGIDLGVHKLAIFLLGNEPHSAAMDMDEKGSRARELFELGAYAHDVTMAHDIDQVWIEDSLIGNNRKYSIQLSETKGAVMAALALHCDVRLVDNGTWKKQVLGNGHATKDDIRDYIRVTHGLYAPLCGDDQDRYDACCIALYGRQIVQRSRHLELADDLPAG